MTRLTRELLNDKYNITKNPVISLYGKVSPETATIKLIPRAVIFMYDNANSDIQ